MTARVEDETCEVWTCICGDNQAVPVNVPSLIENSGYFRALVQSHMKESKEKTIHMPLFSSDTLRFVLQLFYSKGKPLAVFSGETHMDLDTIINVLKAVDYLDMSCLYKCCSDLLSTIVEPLCVQIELLWNVWNMCQTYGLTSTEKVICSYLANHISEVVEKDNMFFSKVPVEVLAGVLSMPNVDLTTEVDVIKYIVTWVNYCPERRRKHVNNLLKCMHVPSLIGSEVLKVKTMLQKLSCPEFSVSGLQAMYKKNPFGYFLSHPEHTDIRNSQKVLMTFGGVYEQKWRRSRYHLVPVLYENIDKIVNACFNHNSAETTTPKQELNKKVLKTKCMSAAGLYLRTASGVKSIKIVEFGVCLHENFVYVAGGQTKWHADARFATGNAYRLYPHNGEWSVISPMKEARCLFFLCCSWGQIYAVGGANQYRVLQCTEYYIPEEDKWYEGPELVTELHEHAGCVFQNKVYISGGHTDQEHTNQVWVLVTQHDTWAPVAPLLQHRSYHSMAALGDNMYVVGGCTNTSSVITDIYSIEQYSPLTNTWTAILAVDVPISCCMPVTIDNRLLYIGGFSFKKMNYVHHIVSVNLYERRWKVSTYATCDKSRLVGYSCMLVAVNQRILK